MNVFQNCSVASSERAFVTVNFENESRFGVRLLIWSPPSSLALTWVSHNNLISRAERFRAAESVRRIRSLRARLFQPTQNTYSDLSVITKQLLAVVTERFKLAYRERLQLLLEWRG